MANLPRKIPSPPPPHEWVVVIFGQKNPYCINSNDSWKIPPQVHLGITDKLGNYTFRVLVLWLGDTCGTTTKLHFHYDLRSQHGGCGRTPGRDLSKILERGKIYQNLNIFKYWN